MMIPNHDGRKNDADGAGDDASDMTILWYHLKFFHIIFKSCIVIYYPLDVPT